MQNEQHWVGRRTEKKKICWVFFLTMASSCFFSFLFNHTFHRAEATAATAECEKLRFLFHRFSRLAHSRSGAYFISLCIYSHLARCEYKVLPRIVWAHLCFRTGRFISAVDAACWIKCNRRVYPDWVWEATVEAKVITAKEILNSVWICDCAGFMFNEMWSIFYFSSFINFMTEQKGHMCDFRGLIVQVASTHTRPLWLPAQTGTKKKNTTHGLNKDLLMLWCFDTQSEFLAWCKVFENADATWGLLQMQKDKLRRWFC